MCPSRVQSFLFPSAAFPGLPACWNVGRLGIFTARIFPSQSNRFQLEPGDSSWLNSVPTLWEMQTSVSPLGQARGNLGFWSCGAQERQ